MSRITPRGILAALALALASGSLLAAPVVLRASHQFPGGKGDVRDEMVQIIARDAKAAGVDLEVQVYPGAALFKPNEQWNALVNGQLDISSFPLDYASGKVREFGATLMPGPRAQSRARGAHGRLAVHEGHSRRRSTRRAWSCWPTRGSPAPSRRRKDASARRRT